MTNGYLGCIAILLSIGFCFGENEQKTEPWDHFVFSQEWPASICINANITHKEKCVIPDKVKTWSVHGLWPSRSGGYGPLYCNNASSLDKNQIKSILDQLQTYWPNLFVNSGQYFFWKYEWSKHGTCAVNHPLLHSQLDYFSKALELRKTFDLLKILTDGGIVPNDSYSYQHAQVVKALKAKIPKPMLLCAYKQISQTYYLAQISFCLDKSFQLIKCPPTDIHFYETNSPASKSSYNFSSSSLPAMQNLKTGSGLDKSQLQKRNFFFKSTSRSETGKNWKEEDQLQQFSLKDTGSSRKLFSGAESGLVNMVRMNQMGSDSEIHKSGKLVPCNNEKMVLPVLHPSK